MFLIAITSNCSSLNLTDQVRRCATLLLRARLSPLQICTEVDGIGRINSAAAFLNVLNPTLLIHHKRCAVGKLSFIIQNTVRFGDLALHVAQEREFHAKLFGEFGIGRNGIDADAQNCGVVKIDFARVDTSLVSLQLFGSTSGEG
jgi:hypothetical protein